jgi:hypothetical protein
MKIRLNLKEIIEKHEKWLNNEPDGERASLKGVDLSYGVDLKGVDLSGADMRGADLSSVNLSDADLSGVNLSDVCMRDVDLSGACMRGCIGNGKEIKSLQIDRYPVAYNKDQLAIGCQQHEIVDWFNDEYVSRIDLDQEDLDLWNKNKDFIKMLIEKYPAVD